MNVLVLWRTCFVYWNEFDAVWSASREVYRYLEVVRLDLGVASKQEVKKLNDSRILFSVSMEWLFVCFSLPRTTFSVVSHVPLSLLLMILIRYAWSIYDIYTVWVKIKYPRAEKNVKNTSHIFRLFVIYDINIYVVVYHQCKYHQVSPFNFRDMTKVV